MVGISIESAGFSVWWDRRIDPGKSLDRAKSVIIIGRRPAQIWPSRGGLAKYQRMPILGKTLQRAKNGCFRSDPVGSKSISKHCQTTMSRSDHWLERIRTSSRPSRAMLTGPLLNPRRTALAPGGTNIGTAAYKQTLGASSKKAVTMRNSRRPVWSQ